MKLIDFIIAEDIRFEAGNKFSIMGIYSEEIRITLPEDVQWPLLFRFGIFIRLELEASDVIPSRFVLNVNHNNNNIAQLSGEIELKDRVQTLTLPLVINPFPMPGFGTIQFNLEMHKDEKKLIEKTHSLQVILEKKKS